MNSRIEQIIEEIEEYIENCRLQPLSTTKIIVNKEHMNELLNELRLKVPDEILTRIKAGFFQDIRLDRLQNTELTQLFRAFEEMSIDYFPIKGTVMKKYYPGSVYRWMSDADIFIREDQYGIISGIMKNAGYSFIDESEHEFRWRKSGFLIEFH